MSASEAPTPKRLHYIRWLWRGLIICPLVYLSSYAVLSATGGWVVTESGEVRLGFVAVADSLIWQPRYGRCEWFRFVSGEHGLRFNDKLGTFYAPLIMLDQKWVHRTVRFLNRDGNLIGPFPAPPLNEYHPFVVHRFHGRFPYENLTHSPAKKASDDK
jgi:hypothetical protein